MGGDVWAGFPIHSLCTRSDEKLEIILMEDFRKEHPPPTWRASRESCLFPWARLFITFLIEIF